ncbi:unnamed protein product [Phytomonas sp. Hart1]|nr:unnamed protein product [Phytomonas sp. Hart1]|eukprot:CCW69231.1 unnamed protein product [Phytomonas sp. isolate Hart1]
MEKVVQLMTRRLVQPTSPFAHGELDEETATMMMMGTSPGEGSEWSPQDDHNSFEAGDFSVRRILHVAGPRIIDAARGVVGRAFARHPSHFFSPTTLITRGELEGLLGELAADMARQVRVSVWTNLPSFPPLPIPAGDPFVTPMLNDGADEVVEFPAGSTAILGRNGKLVSPYAGSSNSFGFENPFDASRRPQVEIDAAGFPVSSGFLADEAEPMDALQREHQINAQSTGFFQELLCSISVEKLVLDYAAETLRRSFREILENLSNVKSYDEATDSVKVLMFIASLEAPRQRLYDAEYDIKSYLKLFCEETVRSTCSQ